LVARLDPPPTFADARSRRSRASHVHRGLIALVGPARTTSNISATGSTSPKENPKLRIGIFAERGASEPTSANQEKDDA